MKKICKRMKMLTDAIFHKNQNYLAILSCKPWLCWFWSQIMMVKIDFEISAFCFFLPGWKNSLILVVLNLCLCKQSINSLCRRNEKLKTQRHWETWLPSDGKGRRSSTGKDLNDVPNVGSDISVRLFQVLSETQRHCMWALLAQKSLH